MSNQIRNPKYKERIERYLERQNFMKLLDIHLDEIKPGETFATMKVKEKHKQQKGLVHGGVVATLADIVAGFAAYTLVPEENNVVTGEIKISYLNPGLGNVLEAKGWVLKPGKKLNFCESEVWDVRNDGTKKLIAKASTTMITLNPGDVGSKNLNK